MTELTLDGLIELADQASRHEDVLLRDYYRSLVSPRAMSPECLLPEERDSAGHAEASCGACHGTWPAEPE